MSRDPYHDVKREVEHHLEQVRTLASSYQRLQQRRQSQTTSSQSNIIEEARRDLQTQIQNLLSDIEDLEASVEAVEESGSRWGISDGEVRERRDFLKSVKGEVSTIRKGADDARSFPDDDSKRYRTIEDRSKFEDVELGDSSYQSRSYRDSLDNDNPRNGRKPSDEVANFEAEQQQMMIRQQDSTMGLISGTLSTLASQAGLMGRELLEQNEMLEDLSLRVDATDSKLTAANKRLKAFIRANEETKSTYCIFILIVILAILLLLVILT